MSIESGKDVSVPTCDVVYYTPMSGWRRFALGEKNVLGIALNDDGLGGISRRWADGLL